MADNENSTFATGVVEGNEIVKAEDFNFSFSSIVENLAKFSKMIFESDKDFVIGGKVNPYNGLNIVINPVFGVCKETGIPFGISENSDPIAITYGTTDRIDIIEAKGEWVTYNNQQRAFNDLDNDTITYQKIDTRHRLKVDFNVKKGTEGSAPDVDEGYVKLAEIHYSANADEITESDIYNITADISTADNTKWTNQKDIVYNVGYISDVNERFRQDHNEDGSHKNSVIDINKLDTGTASTQVSASTLPIGIDYKIGRTDYDGLSPITTIITAVLSELEQKGGATKVFVNEVLSRFATVVQIPLATTANIELKDEQFIDGKQATAGTYIFVKNQEDSKDNGIYSVVKSGAWQRVNEYKTTASLKNKFFEITDGSQKGEIFYLPNEDLIFNTDPIEFVEFFGSVHPIKNKLVIRDENGCAKFGKPKDDSDAARKVDVDTVQGNLVALSDSLGTASKKNAGSLSGNVPIVGENLGATNNNVVATDNNGNLKPVGITYPNMMAASNAGVICYDAKDTQQKSVTLTGFSLYTGAVVKVMFTNGNSASNPTLNVNSTGAKSIKVVKASAKNVPVNHTGYWRGASTTSSEMWQPYTILEFMYDGVDWVIVGNPTVESYSSDTSCYTVKADGLIEQGIKYKIENSGDFQTDIDIIYPISFNQNVYISLVREQNQTNSAKVYIYAKNVTLSEAKITTRVNDFGNFYLKLSGC